MLAAREELLVVTEEFNVSTLPANEDDVVVSVLLVKVMFDARDALFV